jgi:hypothetical protein
VRETVWWLGMQLEVVSAGTEIRKDDGSTSVVSDTRAVPACGKLHVTAETYEGTKDMIRQLGDSNMGRIGSTH